MTAPAPLRFSNEELDAQTPLEFRQLLEKIRAASGLSCGQISIKTKIPRSQTYNLVSSSRTTLPRRPEQVEAFVIACGLPAIQVEIVMGVWRRLDKQSPRTFGPTNATGPTNANAAKAAGAREDDDDDEAERFATRMRIWMHRPKGRNVGADLLFLILNSEQLTRRALLLIYPLVGAWVFALALVGLLVWAGPLNPSTLVGVLTAPAMLPMLVRLATRRRP